MKETHTPCSNLIDGKAIAEAVNRETASEVANIGKQYGAVPGLAVVLVGDNPASQVYVNTKVRKCAELGIYSEKIVLPKETTQAELLAVIDKLNRNPTIHGILVQSPPPPQIDEAEVVKAVAPEKDVDCFHPQNVGRMLLGDLTGFLPCTPSGVMQLLRRSGIETAGKNAVVPPFSIFNVKSLCPAGGRGRAGRPPAASRSTVWQNRSGQEWPVPFRNARN